MLLTITSLPGIYGQCKEFPTHNRGSELLETMPANETAGPPLANFAVTDVHIS